MFFLSIFSENSSSQNAGKKIKNKKRDSSSGRRHRHEFQLWFEPSKPHTKMINNNNNDNNDNNDTQQQQQQQQQQEEEEEEEHE